MTGETEADGGEPAGTTGDVESGQQGTFARVFTERDTQRRLGLILATYVLAGLGIGVAGYFTIDAFTGGSTGFGAEFISAVILIITVVFVGLIGVPIAVLLGPRVSEKLDRPNLETYATMGIGAFVGHLAMFVITVVLLGSKLSTDAGSGSGGGSETGMADFFVPMALAAVGVAVVGMTAVYLERNHDL